jgi:glycosyltransferase involved in cell wall biosynthesis
MTTPAVSVGLPVYNGERYLAEAIASILSQTFADLELIIADNASTDATGEICEHFASTDPRIRYLRSERNFGAAYNYNLTLEHARGHYFKWFAHDDVCRPDFIKVCVEALDADPDLVLAYPTPVDIDENGSELGLRDAGLELDDPDPVQRFRDTMGKAHACLPVFGLTRTDVLRRTGRHGDYPSADRVLLGELALWGGLSEIPEELYLHREHAERFVHTHVTLDEQAAWFDTSRSGGAGFPAWRKLREYLTAVDRAPITGRQRIACYARMGKWSVGMRRDLARDLTSGIDRLREGRER